MVFALREMLPDTSKSEEDDSKETVEETAKSSSVKRTKSADRQILTKRRKIRAKQRGL